MVSLMNRRNDLNASLWELQLLICEIVQDYLKKQLKLEVLFHFSSLLAQEQTGRRGPWVSPLPETHLLP